MPKKPGYIQMNSPEDQKYYDALKAANFCDINDALDMRNFAIVRNGKVTYPFYDIGMESLSHPIYDEKGTLVEGIETPHAELLKKKLPQLAKDGELIYFRQVGTGSADPLKILFSETPDGKMEAKLSQTSLYAADNKFPAPAAPAKISVGHRILSVLSFGLAYRDERRDYNNRVAQWKKDVEAHKQLMEDRKTLLANKPQRDEEDRRALERDEARNFGTKVEKYEHNFKCIYGTKPMKMDNEIASVIDMIGEDTEYTVPDGLTENMCIGLVKLKMMDENIVLNVDLDNTKYVDDVDLCRNALETHAQEDVMAERIGLNKKIGKCIRPARMSVKEALDEYRINGNPKLIGEIIGKNMKYYLTNSSFSDTGITNKSYWVMKNNAAIYDLLETHEDIRKSAFAHGLTERQYQTMSAQKNISQAYENGMAARNKLLKDVPMKQEELEDKAADYLIGKAMSMMIIQQSKVREKAMTTFVENGLAKATADGMKPEEYSDVANFYGKKFMNAFEATEKYNCMGERDKLNKMRKEIQQTPEFRDMIEKMMEKGKYMAVLNNQAKVNRLLNKLDQEFIQKSQAAAPQQPAQGMKIKQPESVQKNTGSIQAGGIH